MAKTRAQETTDLVKNYKQKRLWLVRDAITSKDYSTYRISETAEAAVLLAEHLADAPGK